MHWMSHVALKLCCSPSLQECWTSSRAALVVPPQEELRTVGLPPPDGLHQVFWGKFSPTFRD
jgi:hypothetical protein